MTAPVAREIPGDLPLDGLLLKPFAVEALLQVVGQVAAPGPFGS
jgi:hypothetical protein